MSLRDYEQRLVTERDGRFSEDDQDAPPSHAGPSYDEEQAHLKSELKNALATFEDDEDADDTNLLQKRVKTSAELKAEEEDYFEWLKGQKDHDAETDEYMVCLGN